MAKLLTKRAIMTKPQRKPREFADLEHLLHNMYYAHMWGEIIRQGHTIQETYARFMRMMTMLELRWFASGKFASEMQKPARKEIDIRRGRITSRLLVDPRTRMR